MLDKMVPYGNIPFFWTNHYGKGTQYAGLAYDYDDAYLQGDFKEHKYICFLSKQGKVLAVIG